MKKPIHKVLYVQVIVAIIVGIVLGHFYPNLAIDMGGSKLGRRAASIDLPAPGGPISST